MAIPLPVHAQNTAAPSPKPAAELPKIVEEPKTIDPAAFMPPALAALATVDLSDSSLLEVLQWLRTERKLVVLTDDNALSNIGVLKSDPISDRLNNAPIYMLLNRLRSQNLGWYFEDDILHITSEEMAAERLTTLPYNMADLLDAGYDLETLSEVIESTISPDQWDEVGGPGALSFLGDVMFVSQNDRVQREIQGLLAAIRKPARQTFIFDPPQHIAIRGRLEENVSVDFQNTPLTVAIAELSNLTGANQTKISIRLDLRALHDNGTRLREPMTLKLTDCKLKTVLQAMMLDLDLTWILQDGVLWITTAEQAESLPKTAVYDVRDLCRDEAESDALIDAILSQTASDSWDIVGGGGAISAARPGILVVSNTEDVLTELLNLLETYRTALRSTRVRKNVVDAQNKISRVYYRLHANVAESLETLLPQLVQPESWKSKTHPEAIGEIILAASPPELYAAPKQSVATNVETADILQVAGLRAVLIIRQTRTAHDAIEEVIRRVKRGDPLVSESEGYRGFGGGGGGFGGGFFSAPHSPADRSLSK